MADTELDEQQVRSWLDKNNQTLISEIEMSVPVKFTHWDKDYFACQVHKNEEGEPCEVEVYYKEPLSQEKIAHEFLHAKTSLILGDNAVMFAVENQCVPFKFMMQIENASNIVNACEHNMFFPDYLEMGYKEEDSFEQPKELDKKYEEIEFLVTNGLKENGHYSIKRVFDYFGLVFTFLFYPNDDRFRRQVKQLRKVDVPLFLKLKKLKDDCSDILIEPGNKDFVQNAYFEFATDMNKWFAKAFEDAIFTGEV